MKKKILNNLVNLGFANIGSRILGFFAVMYLSRVLLPKGFGEISFAMAIISYSGLLINLGFNTYGAREIAKDGTKVVEIVNNIITMRFFLSIIAFLLTVCIAYLFIKNSEIRILTILYGVTLFCTALTLDWVFWGNEKLYVVSIAQILGSGIYLASIFFFIKKSGAIYLVPLFYVIGMAATQSVTNIYYRKKISPIKFNFNLASWKIMLHDSIPMGLSIIVISFYSYFNYIILGAMTTARDVGIFSAAYKFIELVSIIAVFTWQAFFPSLSQVFNNQKSDQLQQLGQRFVQVMLTFGFPIGVGCFLLAEQIITFIYGTQFLDSTPLLRVLSISCAGVFFSVSFGNTLLALNQQRYYFFAVMSAAIVNIVLAILLIKVFGPIGAVISYTASELTVSILMYIKFRQYIKIKWFDVFKKVMVPTGGILLFLAISKHIELSIVFTLAGSIGIFLIIVTFRYIPTYFHLVCGKIRSLLLG